jgi:hypothetical protein
LVAVKVKTVKVGAAIKTKVGVAPKAKPVTKKK